MTLDEIKNAVNSGLSVCWSNELYRVVQDARGQWHIRCNHNRHCIGLTHADGVTMNGKPEEFFIITGPNVIKFSRTPHCPATPYHATGYWQLWRGADHLGDFAALSSALEWARLRQ